MWNVAFYEYFTFWIDKKQDRCGDKKQSESIMKSPFEPHAPQIISRPVLTASNKKAIYLFVCIYIS